MMNGGFPGAGSLSLLPRGWDKKFARATQEPHLYCTILPHWCTLAQEPHGWCTLVQEPHLCHTILPHLNHTRATRPQKLVSPALLTSHNIVLTHAKKPNIMTKIVFLVETVFKTPINVKILQLPSSRYCICHTLNFYLWGHAESFRDWPKGASKTIKIWDFVPSLKLFGVKHLPCEDFGNVAQAQKSRNMTGLTSRVRRVNEQQFQKGLHT